MSAKSKNNPTMKTRRLSTTDSTSSASYQRGFAASSAIKKQHDPTNKALWCGRILFLSFLCGAAAALGFAAHHYLSDSETELAEAQFESIADRALTEAAGITSRKRHAILTMASMVSEMHADADDWPFVFVKNFERITNNLLRTTSGDKMAFTPLVKPEELEDWEEFAYDFFYNKHEPPFPNTTAVFPFGRGVWGVRPDLQPPHNIFHDVGNTTYASPHQVLTPTLQTEEGGSPVLMYNFHSDPIRGKPIDDLIDCSTRRRTVDAKEGDCGVVSDMVVSNVPEAKDRGPGGVMFQPIYPANDPNATLVGIIVSPLVWEDILENIIPGQVSGVDAVLSTEQRAFTYHFSHGVAYSEGEGDLHQTRYDGYRKCALLTGDDELYTQSSVVYELCMYPCDDLFQVYATNNPKIATIGAVLVILSTSMLFFVYDFLVRREFHAKRELLQAKRRFMRFVSHEVRTPLNSVCMGLTVIQTEIAASLGHKSAEDLELRADEAARLASTPGRETDQRSLEWFSLAQEVRTSAQSAVDVLSDLLNYDRIESGGLNLELALVRIWRLVERTACEFKLPAVKKKLDFKLVFDELSGNDTHRSLEPASDTLTPELQSQKIVGDAVRLTQVFRNLLSNAVKFTTEGGSIRVRASWIRPTDGEKVEREFTLADGNTVSLRSNGMLQVSVQDSGAGMSVEQVAKLFRDGVQFNVNELQAGQGSGLGLYISKGIVGQHGGSLVASSEGLGKGSTLTLTLPLYHAPETTPIDAGVRETLDVASCESTSGAESFSFLRVLVVDDVTSNRKLLCRLLRNHHHECDEADNGSVAVEMVRKAMVVEGSSYDCVLMDFEMPVMNGPSAAKAIRNMGCDVFIVGVTGNLLPDDVAFFRSSGANTVLPKPFQMADLEDLWMENNVTSSRPTKR